MQSIHVSKPKLASTLLTLLLASQSETYAQTGGQNKCENHPKTWDEALHKAEMKQWPQAANKQPSIDLSGVYLFPSQGDSNETCQQVIWQECLELTITGGCTDNATGKVVSKGPIHHFVMDYEYGHVDMYGTDKCPVDKQVNGNCYADLGPEIVKTLVVDSTQDWCESYGADHAVLMVGTLMSGKDAGPIAVGWNAARAVDRNGNLVFAQNPDAVKAEGDTVSETVLTRAIDQSVQCGTHSGFDPKSMYCKKRSYLDASWSFTPACCSSNATLAPFTKFMDNNLYPPQNLQPFPYGPNIASCDGSTPARKY